MSRIRRRRLRARASEDAKAGVRLAQNELAAACQALDQLGKTIARRTGRKNGLTPTQAAQLSAATTHIAAEVGC